MQQIGNARDAQTIANYYYDDGIDVNGEWKKRVMPEGWKRLGSGCYRTAFLSPDGVVYKVQQWQNERENQEEYDRLRRLYFTCKMPKDTRLPHATYYSGPKVIAMEYFDTLLNRAWGEKSKSGMEYNKLKDQIMHQTGLRDMHGSNLAIDQKEKVLVPIDLGYSTSNWY